MAAEMGKRMANAWQQRRSRSSSRHDDLSGSRKNSLQEIDLNWGSDPFNDTMKPKPSPAARGRGLLSRRGDTENAVQREVVTRSRSVSFYEDDEAVQVRFLVV